MQSSDTKYVDLLRALLIEERGKSPVEADKLIKEHPTIVVNGILSGNISLRGCAMALVDFPHE